MKKLSKTRRATKPAALPSTSINSKGQKKERYEPFGAPTKYRPEFCQGIIEHAKKPGGTLKSYAVSIGVHYDTLQEWAKTHPNFSSARKRAKETQEEVMFKLGIKGMMGRNGQGAWQGAWIFAMKARFGWREDAPLDDEENDVEFDFE